MSGCNCTGACRGWPGAYGYGCQNGYFRTGVAYNISETEPSQAILDERTSKRLEMIEEKLHTITKILENISNRFYK